MTTTNQMSPKLQARSLLLLDVGKRFISPSLVSIYPLYSSSSLLKPAAGPAFFCRYTSFLLFIKSFFSLPLYVFLLIMDSVSNITAQVAATSAPPWTLPNHHPVFLVFIIFAPVIFLFIASTTLLLYLRRHHSPSVKYGAPRLLWIQAISAACISAYFSVVTSKLRVPCFMNLWFDNVFLTLYVSAITARAVRYLFIKSYDRAKLRLTVHGNLYIDSPKHGQGPRVDVRSSSGGSDTLRWYRKKKQYASDKALTRAVFLFLIVVLGLSAAIYFTNNKPGQGFAPNNTSCDIGERMALTFGIVILFLCVIAPYLGYKLSRMDGDAYFIRTDLLTSICVGVPMFGAFLLWGTLGGHLNGIISGHFFLLLAFICTHTGSIMVPLVSTFRRGKIDSTSEENQGVSRSAFEKTLADEQGFENYKLCAAATFTTELMVFLDDYQNLKEDIVEFYKRGGSDPKLSNPPKAHGRKGSKEAIEQLFYVPKIYSEQEDRAHSRKGSDSTLVGKTLRKGSDASLFDTFSSDAQSRRGETPGHSRKGSGSSQNSSNTSFLDFDNRESFMAPPPLVVTKACDMTAITVSIGDTLGLPHETRLPNASTTDLSHQGQHVFGHTVAALQSQQRRPGTSSSTSSQGTLVPSYARVPFALESHFKHIFDRFFVPDADCELNMPSWVIADIQKYANGNWRLDMYDRAMQEVLNLLFENTFMRYQKMFNGEQTTMRRAPMRRGTTMRKSLPEKAKVMNASRAPSPQGQPQGQVHFGTAPRQETMGSRQGTMTYPRPAPNRPFELQGSF